MHFFLHVGVPTRAQSGFCERYAHRMTDRALVLVETLNYVVILSDCTVALP